jgi:hypothetical protein
VQRSELHARADKIGAQPGCTSCNQCGSFRICTILLHLRNRSCLSGILSYPTYSGRLLAGPFFCLQPVGGCGPTCAAVARAQIGACLGPSNAIAAMTRAFPRRALEEKTMRTLNEKELHLVSGGRGGGGAGGDRGQGNSSSNSNNNNNNNGPIAKNAGGGPGNSGPGDKNSAGLGGGGVGPR